MTEGDKLMARAIHFKHGELAFVPTRAPGGETRIARVIDTTLSEHLGGGIEVMEGVSITWTVTYDEILFIHEGSLGVIIDGQRLDCEAGDIVWLPKGTTLTYDAPGRCAYFYALYPVDWAARQGTTEP